MYRWNESGVTREEMKDTVYRNSRVVFPAWTGVVKLLV